MQNRPGSSRRISPPGEPGPDLRLVRAALAGQEAAIDELATRMRCVSRILAAQNARMGRPLDDHDVADLAQDTLMVLMRKLQDFAGRASLERWIYRVCALELHNGIRRKRRRQRTSRSSALADEPAAPAGETAADVREEVRLALDRLADDELEVIRLKHFEDLTFEAIGERLRISPNTAKTRYYRGLSALERYLGPRLDLGGGP